MPLKICREQADAKAFVACRVTDTDTMVALCKLRCVSSEGLYEAVQPLMSLGVFPFPLSSLRVVIRGDNNEKGTVYDVTSILALPKSHRARGDVCALGDCDVEEAPREGLVSAIASGRYSTRVVTVGSIDVRNLKHRHHVMVFDSTNKTLLASGDISSLSSIAKQAAALKLASLLIVFGSTLKEGVPSTQGTVKQNRAPSVSSVTYLDGSSESLNSHLASFVSTIRLEAGGQRYIVPATQYIVVPVMVPSDDATARRSVHSLLALPSRHASLTSSNGIELRASESPFEALEGLPQPFVEYLAVTTMSPLASKPAGVPESIIHLVPGTPDGPSAQPKKGATQISLTCLARPKVIPNSATYVVDESLAYFHYKVDGFNDEGWGCAYRSLQLVLSWFQHKQIMHKPIPSVLEIQKLLSNIDPEKAGKKTFVGSKEWIGSFEVMMVVQHYVEGLECTLQRLETGKELDNNPAIHRLLATHFEKGGCPVMIGGSAYAHTIIGIDVNIRTSQAQYLIVDPHYPATSPDAAAVVQKGWVGWKDASKFFNQSTWYNMCVPRVYDLDLS